MPSGQEYANRLQEDAHRTLAPQIDNLEQEINIIKTDLALSLSQLGEKLEAIRNLALPMAESVILEALEDASHEKASQSAALAQFARNVRARETQEDILNELLDEAARFAPRLALFVVRGRRFLGWSSRGFSQSVADGIRQSAFDFAAGPLFEKALGCDAATSSGDIADEFVWKVVGEEASGPWHLFPLKAVGRPVAVLLAAASEGHVCDLDSLSIVVDLTGICVENIALRILHEAPPQMRKAATMPRETIPQHPPAAASAEAAEARSSVGAGVTEPGIPVHLREGEAAPVPPEAAVEAPPEAAVVPELPAASPETVVEEEPPVEPMAEPVAVVSELEEVASIPQEHGAMTTAIGGGWVQEAEIESRPAIPAPAPEPEAAPAKEMPALADEQEAHSYAKRFARLLVSEIKLYNEQRVVDGRHNRDLYVRLKKDIDKSREMYEKRIPPSVTSKIDYFHDELVRILGENDPSTLGSDYPGPRVET